MSSDAVAIATVYEQPIMRAFKAALRDANVGYVKEIAPDRWVIGFMWQDYVRLLNDGSLARFVLFSRGNDIAVTGMVW